MSHSAGVLCAHCEEELADSWCDECRVLRSHGWTYQYRDKWAAETWPEHECFQD